MFLLEAGAVWRRGLGWGLFGGGICVFGGGGSLYAGKGGEEAEVGSDRKGGGEPFQPTLFDQGECCLAPRV